MTNNYSRLVHLGANLSGEAGRKLVSVDIGGVILPLKNQMPKLFDFEVKGTAANYGACMPLTHDSFVTSMLKEKKAEQKGEKN